VIAAILSAVDWLIGPSGREKVQKRVGDWWVLIEETAFGDNIAEYARRFLMIYRHVFECEDRFDWWMRRLIWSFTPGSIALGIATALWVYTHGLGRRLVSGETGASPQILLFPMLLSLAVSVVSIWIIGWLLRTLVDVSGYRAVIRFVFLTAVYVSCLTMMLIVSILLVHFYEYSVRPLYTPNIVHSKYSTDIVINELGLQHEFHLDQFITGMTLVFCVGSNIIALIVFLGVQLFIIAAKLFSFALKPACSLLLRRFYESKKGVLTVIAVGCGALATLLQELVKNLSAS
jgi:hypothetical protein